MDYPPVSRWFICLFLLSISPVYADYRDDVGYTKLQAELSSGLPTGAGISVTQVEASISAESPIYMPDTTLTEFSGKTFTNKSGTPDVSFHATAVGQNFYSNTNSIAPGVTAIDVYNASSWIGSGYLRSGGFSAPKTESRDIQNHSWIGSSSTNEDVLRRLDFAVERDDFIAVVGLNNGFGNPVPSLLGSAYNVISVGLTNGNHSSGTTTVDGSGRQKPDIVSVQGATSFATPHISAAAAMLLQKIRSSSIYSMADHSIVIKSLLLAGATKTPFPTWSRSSTQPLDVRYGAGQLNIHRSYYDLIAGRQAPSISADVKSRGWDFNSASTATTRRYFLNIPANNTTSDFSVILTWNRIVTSGITYTASLADLSLKLYTATGYTVGSLVDSSVSTVDNVEHIYQPNLAPGRYALEITSSQATSTNYGLAWTSLANVQIVADPPAASEKDLSAGGYTVTRSGGDTATALQVFYTIGGNASNGADYASLASSITFAAGETMKHIAVVPLADTLAEGDETVSLTLTPDLAYALDTSTTASVTIRDLPFDAWRFSKFTTAELADSAISGSIADPDADGIANLLEYALALEPTTVSTTGLPTTALENDSPTLTYTRVKAATDLLYLPQISDDLLTWQSGSATLSESVISDNGPTETVKVTPNANPATAQFLRLRITRP